MFNDYPLTTVWTVELNALYEAVEVLEDLLAHEKDAGEGWKQAAAAYYGETLNLKSKIRELNADAAPRLQSVNASRWQYWKYHDPEMCRETDSALTKTKAALADAQERIAELHKQNDEYREALTDISRMPRPQVRAYAALDHVTQPLP